MATYSKNGKLLGRPPGSGKAGPAAAAVRGRWTARYQAATADSVPQRGINPRDFTPEKRAAFVEALRQSFNVRMAAEQAGVSRATIHNWRKHNAEFRTEIEEVFAEGYLDAKAKMLALALNGTRRTEIIDRIGPNRMVRTIESDAPALLVAVMRLNLAEAIASGAVQNDALAMQDQPSDDQLCDWMLADIEAAEARVEARMEARVEARQYAAAGLAGADPGLSASAEDDHE